MLGERNTPTSRSRLARRLVGSSTHCAIDSIDAFCRRVRGQRRRVSRPRLCVRRRRRKARRRSPQTHVCVRPRHECVRITRQRRENDGQGRFRHRDPTSMTLRDVGDALTELQGAFMQPTRVDERTDEARTKRHTSSRPRPTRRACAPRWSERTMTRSTSRGRARVTVDPFPKRPRASDGEEERRETRVHALDREFRRRRRGRREEEVLLLENVPIIPPKDVFLEQHCRADLLSVHAPIPRAPWAASFSGRGHVQS